MWIFLLTLHIPFMQSKKLIALDKLLIPRYNASTHRIWDPLELQQLNVNSRRKLRALQPLSVLRSLSTADLRKGPVGKGASDRCFAHGGMKQPRRNATRLVI